MPTDIALDETIAFIRSKPEHLELALAVESAMPELRNRVYGTLMGDLLKRIDRTKGTWYIAQHFWGKRKQGHPHQLQGLRLHQRRKWTHTDRFGGVWFWRMDNNHVQVGVQGFRDERQTIKERLETAFGGFDEFGNECAVKHQDENQMQWTGLREERLLAMSDDKIEKFARRVADQMDRLVQVIRDS